METLRRQIRRAQRRLILQAFAARLAWCWFATLLVAAVAIGLGKIWPLADERTWTVAWLGGALAAGLLAAAVWTWLVRNSAAEAAYEIDRRFGLKERVSSALAIGGSDMRGVHEADSDMGRALVSDALQRIERIDVAERFGVRLNRWALMPLAPAAIALALALFVTSTSEQAVEAAKTEREAVKKSTQALAHKLEEKRKKAAEAGLEEANTLIKRLEQGTSELAEKSQADRKQTLVKLNELVKDAEQRRERLAGSTELKQQLAQLKNLEQGPAQKMAAALKQGDLKKALGELDKLKAQLEGEKLNPQEKEALAKQLDQMKQAMDKAAQAHEQAKSELKKQIESERRAGNVAKADKLQQQLDKLAEKQPQMDKLKQMAQQMAKAQQAMQQDQMKDAAQSLSKVGEQLSEMAKEMEEMAMLDEALEQIADAKNAMNCKQCQGEGCAECQGEGNKPGDQWAEKDWATGGGTGAGKRDKQASKSGFFDSQVQQNVGRGAMVLKGQAEGPNKKGDALEAIKTEFSGAPQQSSEVLSGQRLPHDYRDHAKGYFDALREGQR